MVSKKNLRGTYPNQGRKISSLTTNGCQAGYSNELLDQLTSTYPSQGGEILNLTVDVGETRYSKEVIYRGRGGNR